MKNNRYTILMSIFFISLISVSAFIYAAGSSTTPSNSISNSTTSDNNTDKEENRTYRSIQTQNRTIDCDSPENRRERIKCRLQNNATDEEIDYEKRIPEACATLRNPTACIALYKRVQSDKCYDLDGRRKDYCLKRAANITRANFSDISKQERAEKLRNYLVLLLYELQERIENANDNGKISDDDAADIIELIVQIKEDILNNKKRAEILPKLNDLKQKIRALRSGSEIS